MKTIRTLILVTFVAVGLGCGYSNKSMMAASPGTMPVIVQMNPADASAGGAAFQLQVAGSGFSANAVINFNNAAMATTFMNSGKLVAMIPAAAIMNMGTVPVTVTNPGTSGGMYGGGTMGQTSAAMNFMIN